MEPIPNSTIEYLLQRARNRGSYLNTLSEFGIEVPPPRKLTRKEKLRAKLYDYKDRISRATQILWRGYYDGEGMW